MNIFFRKLEFKIKQGRFKCKSVCRDYISWILKMGYEGVDWMQHPKATVQGLTTVK